MGTHGAALTCTITEEPAQRGAVATASLANSLKLDWGKVETVSDSRTVGLTVDVTGGEQTGWQYAHWLVAHAAERGVKSVTFGNRTWTAKGGTWSAPSVDPAVAGLTRQVDCRGLRGPVGQVTRQRRPRRPVQSVRATSGAPPSGLLLVLTASYDRRVSAAPRACRTSCGPIRGPRTKARGGHGC